MGKDLNGNEIGQGLTQRKDGKYYARFSSCYGKQVGMYFDNLRDAKKWLEKAKYEDEHGINYFEGKNSYGEFVEIWFNEIAINQLKATTIATYRAVYRANIEPYLSKLILKEIKPMQIQYVLNKSVQKNLSKRSISIVRTFLKKTFDSAVDNDLIMKSPVRTTVFVKVENKKKQKENYLTIEEQKIFEEELPWTMVGMALRVLLYSGLRIGELMALKWENIDFRNRVIHVEHTMNYLGLTKEFYEIGSPKTEKGYRDVPMLDKAYQVLKTLYADKQQASVDKFEGIIFLAEDGMPMTESNYRARMDTILKSCNISGVTVHGLRHTFACRCIESGMDLKTLQDILGHESSSTTMDYYLHVGMEAKTNAMNKTEEYMNEVLKLVK